MTIGKRVETAVKYTLAVVSRCGRYFRLEFEREGKTPRENDTQKVFSPV
jgi:hypothetical protein